MRQYCSCVPDLRVRNRISPFSLKGNLDLIPGAYVSRAKMNIVMESTPASITSSQNAHRQPFASAKRPPAMQGQ